MNIQKFWALAILIFFVSCSDKPKTADEAETAADDLLVITAEQFELNKMELIKPFEAEWHESVHCKGIIEASPDGVAQAGTLLNGIVQNVFCTEGDFVQQGKVLCTVTCHEWLELQRDYADAYVKFVQAEAEYNRISGMYNQGVGSEKEMLAYRSEFAGALARRNALKLQLQLMHVAPEQVEEGNFAQTFSIRAPISGFVTRMKAVRGQTIDVGSAPFEIVNTDKLQLKLLVFENEAAKIAQNQEVEFRVLSDPAKIFSAVIYKTGKSIDPETKSVISFALIDKELRNSLVNNSFVDAEIKTDRHKIVALPADALVETTEGSFALILEKRDNENYYFRKIKPQTGLTSEALVEIIGGISDKFVLSKGAFNLISD